MKGQLWEKFEKHLLNQGLTEIRRRKLHAMFNLVERNLPGGLENAYRPEIEEFIHKLNANKIQKINRWDGEPLHAAISSTTKSDVKKFLKQFYKWLRGNNELYPPEVAWIRTKIAKDEMPQEKEVVSLDEVKLLAEALGSDQYRALTLLCFDSGFRISEMLSVRKRDLTLEEFDEGQKCYWVTCQVSKTQKRKVPVPLFTEDIRHFTTSAYYAGLHENDSLFSVEYPAYLKQLKTKSLKMFNRKVTPHALRHSSATYYSSAFQGNMNLIADRFGWSYDSPMLAIYIRKSGAYQKPQAKQIYTNDVVKLKEENERLKQEMDGMKRDMLKVISQLETVLPLIAKQK